MPDRTCPAAHLDGDDSGRVCEASPLRGGQPAPLTRFRFHRSLVEKKELSMAQEKQEAGTPRIDFATVDSAPDPQRFVRYLEGVRANAGIQALKRQSYM